MIISTLFTKMLSMIYPENIYCISCGCVIDRTDIYSLCKDCILEFSWANSKTCAVCGKPLQEWYSLDLCTDCMTTEHYFDKAFTCVQFNEKTKDIVHNLKYNGKTYVAKQIAQMIKDNSEREKIDFDCIIPVPIHKSKENIRGYNQTEIIAKRLCELTLKQCFFDVLVKTKQTVSMSKLSAAERMQNLNDSFTVQNSEKIFEKNILLIDDVYTTGSTGDECSKVLKEGGAGKVWLMTFAAGQNAFKNQGKAE